MPCAPSGRMNVRLCILITQLHAVASELDGMDPVVMGIVQPDRPMLGPLLGLWWTQTGARKGTVYLQLGGTTLSVPTEFNETLGFDCDMDDW